MKKIHLLCHFIGHSYPKNEWNEMEYCQRCKGYVDIDIFPVFIENFKKLIIQLFNYSICKIFNHDWEDESYGNPESGYIGMSCKRCGLSHRQILY